MKKVLILALLAATGLSASAANVTAWGTLGPAGMDARAYTTTPGAVDDVYTFALGDPSDVLSTANYYTATSLLGVNTLDLVGATLSLYKGTYGDGVADQSMGSIAFGTSMTDHTFADLTSGNYYFEVTGTAGTEGSDYYLDVAANTDTGPLAVPEPENAALLLAGLGTLAVMLRRRKQA